MIKRDSNGESLSLVIQDNSKVIITQKDDKLVYTIKGNIYFSTEVLLFKAFSLDGITGVSVIKYASDIYSDQGLGYGAIV